MVNSDSPRCLILTTYTPYASTDTMTSDIVFALKRFGYQVGHYVGGNYGDPRLFQAMVLEIGRSSAPAFVLELNGKINPKTMNPKVGEESLFDSWKLPRVSFVIDNLFQHAANIAAAPSYSMIGVIDADSLEWTEELQSRTRRYIHTPHAGPEAPAKPVATSDRPIDLLFAGNVYAVPSLNAWLEGAVEVGKLGSEISSETARDILGGAIERSLETEIGMFQSVRRTAGEKSVELSLQPRSICLSRWRNTSAIAAGSICLPISARRLLRSMVRSRREACQIMATISKCAAPFPIRNFSM